MNKVPAASVANSLKNSVFYFEFRPFWQRTTMSASIRSGQGIV